MLTTTLFYSCEHEEVFKFKPPTKLVSWAEFLDSTKYQGEVKLNNNSVFFNSRSSFRLTGQDTLYSFLIKFPYLNKYKNIAFSVNVGDMSKPIVSASLINATSFLTANYLYNTSEIKIDSISLIIGNLDADHFVLNGILKINAKNSIGYKDTMNFEFKNLKIEKSFVHLYKDKKLVPLDLNFFNCDLKGGSEYNPNPTMDFDVAFMQKIIVSIPMNLGVDNYFGNDLNSMLYFKNRNKFWLSDKTGYLKINRFFYNDNIHLNFSTRFADTAQGSTDEYTFDSAVISYSRISL
jgi:hypothetical protein